MPRTMQALTLGFLLSAGCAPEPTPGATPGLDLRAAYLGDCVVTIEASESGLPSATYTRWYSEHGDAILQERTAVDGTEMTWAYEYGEPHELTLKHFDAEGEQDDYIEHYRWEDGLQVYFAEDEEADGSLDVVRITEYDEHGLYSQRFWHHDADNVADAQSTFAWVASGGGWLGTSEGQDTNGTTWAETLVADAEAWIHDYTYDRETYHSSWSYTPRNELGYSILSTSHTEEEGLFTIDDQSERVLDALGRLASYERTYETWDVDEGTSLILSRYVYTYDCPEPGAGVPDTAQALPSAWYCASAAPPPAWLGASLLVLLGLRRRSAHDDSEHVQSHDASA